MSVLAIIAALVLEQWRPLDGRTAYAALLARWAAALEHSFNAGQASQGVVAWVAAVVPLLILSLVVHTMLASVHPVLAWAFNVIVLYATLGFRKFSHSFTAIQAAIKSGNLEHACDLLSSWRSAPAAQSSREEIVRLSIEEALLASHRHVFGVLFWYVLLPGPSGAILYRAAAFLSNLWQGPSLFGRFATSVFAALEWPAARITAIAFAVVGDFEDSIYCWRSQAHTWPNSSDGVVLAAGAGAMGVRLGIPLQGSDRVSLRPEIGVGESADAPFLDSTVGLLWRAMVLWVLVLVLLTSASLLG